MPAGDAELQAAIEDQLRLQLKAEVIKESIKDDLRSKVEEMKQMGEEVGAPHARASVHARRCLRGVHGAGARAACARMRERAAGATATRVAELVSGRPAVRRGTEASPCLTAAPTPHTTTRRRPRRAACAQLHAQLEEGYQIEKFRNDLESQEALVRPGVCNCVCVYWGRTQPSRLCARISSTTSHPQATAMEKFNELEDEIAAMKQQLQVSQVSPR